MPRSRQRPGHDYQKPADVPASQRVKGRAFWAILFAIFGLGIAFFAGGTNWVYLLVGALLGAVIGYYAGKSMEKDVRS